MLHWQLTLYMADFWQMYAPSCSTSQGSQSTNGTVLSHLCRLCHLILFVGHKDSVGSKKSKHNTDHAVHKTVLRLVLEATQTISDLRLPLMAEPLRCAVSGSSAPRHACISSSLITEIPSRWTVSNGGRRRCLLSTESLSSDIFHTCSCDLKLHYIIRSGSTWPDL